MVIFGINTIGGWLTMLKFIICDDKQEFLNKEVKIVENFMMNYDIEYECHVFKEYDSEFMKIAKEDVGFKVYLLDIQTKYGSGLDMARKIREEYDDWVSVIIIVTAYPEYKYEALGNRLYLFDFINKLDNYETKLSEDLERTLKNYDNREKCLNFEFNYVVKKLEFRHIIMIEKEKDSKRCLIKTTYGDCLIGKTLNSTFKMLDNRFIKTSRSVIINIDQVLEFDIPENRITFKNGMEIFDISRDHKKSVIKRLSEKVEVVKQPV